MKSQKTLLDDSIFTFFLLHVVAQSCDYQLHIYDTLFYNGTFPHKFQSLSLLQIKCYKLSICPHFNDLRYHECYKK